MATDDNRFQRLIEQYLTNNGWQHDKCCGTVERAFRQVQEYRQKKGNSLDLDYAAAEHYLFARFMVCTGTISQTQMKALSAGYDAKKLLDRARGEPNKEAVTGNPVSPPSWHVVRWGMKGAVEGGADCKRCNGSADPPLWKPVDEVLGQKTYGGGYGTRKEGS